MANHLYYGDNLDVLRLHVKDESVDLVYLDPPFNSNADYNVLFGHADGSRAAAQIKAFEDTWRWDQASAAAFEEVVGAGGDVAQALVAFRQLLGDADMLAYLAMMAPRLVELRRVMKPEASIFLHCDPTASHYLKLLMDSVFGAANFRNEIVWSYRRWTASRKSLPRLHDTILFYGKTSEGFFKVPTVPNVNPNPSQYVSAKDATGKTVVARDEHGKPIKREVAEEIQVGDVWEIPMLSPVSKERLGYPTQKPLRLLERILEMSSEPGQTALDPFCGCGTTIVAAEKLKRRWIGIDITYLAVALMKSRLADLKATNYDVVGEPTAEDDAAKLAVDDPYQFQWWALGLIGARPTDGKKGGDKGIDGRLFFFDEPGGTAKQLVVSVKAGNLTPAYVRDLAHVVDREGAQLGALISLREPTAGMRAEAASAGFYTSPWGKHPRIQLVTVGELLAGRRLNMPATTGTTVALPAQPAAPDHPEQMTLAPGNEEE